MSRQDKTQIDFWNEMAYGYLMWNADVFRAAVYKPVALYFFLTTFVDPFKHSFFVALAMWGYMFFNQKTEVGRTVNLILMKSFIVGRVLGAVAVAVVIIKVFVL